jgi:hypothetical protein
LTKQQIKDSPDIAADQPVSRQMETHIYDYYRWSPYWGTGFYMGGYGYLPGGAAGLLGDAMAGDGALFTREDAVEAAWAVVDPVLEKHRAVRPYDRHSWGPKEADAIVAGSGGWHNPTIRSAKTRR